VLTDADSAVVFGESFLALALLATLLTTLVVFLRRAPT
jgi:hypothetical protein